MELFEALLVALQAHGYDLRRTYHWRANIGKYSHVTWLQDRLMCVTNCQWQIWHLADLAQPGHDLLGEVLGMLGERRDAL